jgi:hypothetical protein
MAVLTRTQSALEQRTTCLVDPSLWPRYLQRAFPARSVRVPGIARDVRVEIASSRDDWEQAFQLVADNYQSRGYDTDGHDYRFTSYHALPETVVLVAKERGRVLATLSLVMDNTLLGLPMETIYGVEVRELRRAGRRLCEVGSLADTSLSTREFVPVFVALIRLAWQHHVRHGGDTGVITVNPRHRYFYTKVLGFAPLGNRRACPAVRNHPAEAFLLDVPLLRRNAPEMHRQIFGDPLPPEALRAPRMAAELARYFGGRSSQTNIRLVEEVLRHVDEYGSPRFW